MKITKVYAVIAGIDYEGENIDTLELFDCYSTAVKYKEQLENGIGVDYVMIHQKTINMESALATA